MRIDNGKTVLFAWPLAQHILTSGWTYNNGSRHQAIDLRAAVGTPVFAAEDGTIDWVQQWDGHTKSGNQSYGNLVRVKHEPYNGKMLQTLSGHLSSVVVKYGDKVKEGQIIGYSGNTGNSYGPHLHFEVRLAGTRYNPLNWLDGSFTCANNDVAKHLGNYTSVKRPVTYSNLLLTGMTASNAKELLDLIGLLGLSCQMSFDQISAGDIKAVKSRAEALGIKAVEK